MGVVIVIDIDHQTAQQLTNLVGDLNFELSELSGLDMGGDVVIGEKGHPRFPKAFTDPYGNGGIQARSVSVGGSFGMSIAIAVEGSAIGDERDSGSHWESSEGADCRHQGEVFDDLIGGLLGQMNEGVGRLIDGEHGTTIEITLYGFFVPEG